MQDLFFRKERIRSPVVGGMFYPEDEEDVLSCLGTFDVKPGTGGCASALIVPHGAWDISGSVAGEAFSAATGRRSDPSLVVLLGSIHGMKKEDGIFLSESHSFRTPLGDLPVEQHICKEFDSCSTAFHINDIPHLREHSLEVLLPFIKYCFPRTSILPILMGPPRQPAISALAQALRIVLEPIMDKTLVVVSCNLAVDRDETKALNQTEECIKLMIEKNATAFCKSLFQGQISPCGGGPVASLLKSGLVDAMRPCLVSNSLIHARCDNNDTVYYGALSYE
jgi:AmmeMemoRadiSam system protein B